MTGASDAGTGWRLRADRLERDLASSVQKHLVECIDRGDIAESCVHVIGRLRAYTDALGLQVLSIVEETRLADGAVAIALDPGEIARRLQIARTSISSEALSLQLPFGQRRRGVENRLVIGAGQPARDDILISNIARASAWREALCMVEDLATIAARDGFTVKYLGQMLVFAFLSPRLVRAILVGRQPPALTTNWIRRRGLPASWAEQDRILSQL